MSKKPTTAISPTRAEDFATWYQKVIQAAELADNSDVRGCMVIRPWGYGVWELIQKSLDLKLQATGHENAYFPLFIPLSYLEKEAEHVEGFAKECAVVTHHRLVQKDDGLVPDGELEEPLVVRPTSETIIGASFSKWVQSYRDLPLLINQWANVVRWEMRPRVFLRTAEFLWQEGHTVHATEDDARSEVELIINIYRDLVEGVLAIPVVMGAKSKDETFPGAVQTLTIEAMMQDGKALQAGTSHYLGQNFAKAADIKYQDQVGEEVYAHTTSWGVSTRLIGGLIMTHSDDDGLRLPPAVAPKHVVILPVIPKEEQTSEVLEYADKVARELAEVKFRDDSIRITVDRRDLRGGEKAWSWIKKGAPVRLEIGPRDIKENKVVLYRRDQQPKDKEFVTVSELKSQLSRILEDIHNSYYNQAKSSLEENTHKNIETYDDLKKHFSDNQGSGFVHAKWAGDVSQVAKLKDLQLTIRCIPMQQSGTEGKCIFTGDKAGEDIIIAKAY